MKKIFMGAVALVLCLLLCSCGESSEKEADVTTVKSDWRNTIEYEGSFYVNESLKVLYALDTGSITLWDNAGKGNVLQVINYDTSVADAIERIEKEDFNGDAHCDIRIIYSEGEKGSRYNLFLWSDLSKRFVDCQLYSSITDPVHDAETKNVIGVTDMGAFGTVTRTYAFNDTLGLDEINVTFSDPQGTAGKIAAATVGGTVSPSSGNAKVEGIDCESYTVSEGGKDIAFIAYSTEPVWYIDEGCIGLYREVLENDSGEIVLGDYAGNAKGAYSLAKLIGGESASFVSTLQGYLNEKSAVCYKIKGESGDFYIATDNKGTWFCSENGAAFVTVSTATGELIGDEELEFSLPLE